MKDFLSEAKRQEVLAALQILGCQDEPAGCRCCRKESWITTGAATGVIRFLIKYQETLAKNLRLHNNTKVLHKDGLKHVSW